MRRKIRKRKRCHGCGGRCSQTKLCRLCKDIYCSNCFKVYVPQLEPLWCFECRIITGESQTGAIIQKDVMTGYINSPLQVMANQDAYAAAKEQEATTCILM